MPAIIIVLIVALSGGTAFAAEGSLPGEALYPVKVNVNERVRSAFAFSTEADAQVQTDLAERRLIETEELVVRGEFNQELRLRLEERFDAHAERVREHIARLEADGRTELAADLSSRLETMLEAHEQILARLSGEAEVDSEVILPILERVRMHVDQSMQIRMRVTERIENEIGPESEEAARNKRASAMKKIEAAERSYARVEGDLDVETQASIEAKISGAHELIAQGDAFVEAGEYGNAFVSYQAAHRMAQQAELMARTSIRLDIRLDLRSQSPNHVEMEEETEVETDQDTEIESDDDEAGAEVELRGRGRQNVEIGL